MSLPPVSWRDILKALHKIDFVPVRQKGSHIVVQHKDGRFTVVPRHDPVDRGTHLEFSRMWGYQRKIL